MAAQLTTKPAYHSPCGGTVRRNQSRSRSTRASFTSVTSPASPKIGTARPHNPVPFSFKYKPDHLTKWLIPEHIWTRLPREVQVALAAVQHAGAAASTACERLHQHDLARDDDLMPPVVDEEAEVQSQDTLSKSSLSLDTRTFSSDSSSLGDSVSNLGDSMYSPVFSSQSSGSTVSSPALTASQTVSPTSPTSPNSSFCLTPNDEVFAHPDQRPREGSSSTPKDPTSKDPHAAYYAAELSHIRTEAMPRLCHLRAHVDAEWYEAKRRGTVAADDIPAFESAWTEKKDYIHALNEHCKGIAKAEDMPNAGLGWTYA
ncbi:hypothetical protein BDV96DRAFT_602070 [Lophiotrema nucula]|uniref:Uncharacterized protein n=1 Tax=Lophiotrema nucula TaxID=690887 RepID=A0A6A5YZV3_9PLEO|nr:hypothetical protein BDV96DRAFT_602070 [Lophiotrema nucula]